MPLITIHHLLYTHPDTTALRATRQLDMPTVRPSIFGVSTTVANGPIFLAAYAGLGPSGYGGLRLLAE